jgi:type I restriction enzyme S subunit
MHTLFTKGLNGEAQKETEIGRVPKSWEVVRLGEIGDSFIGGGTPSTKKLQYWDGKIPWITSAYITGLYITDGQRYISQEGLANSSTNLIPKNNVLIGTRVGVGKIAINLIDVAINQDLTGMIVDKQKANLKFVAYVLSSNGIQEEFRNMRRGTTIKGITREDLKRIKVPFPPLEAQHQIAHILSTVDNKIDVEERRKATLKELFKTMLHKLMTGEIRLNKMEI